MPLSRLGADGGAGCAEGGGADWPGEGMPLSRLGGGGAEDCVADVGGEGGGGADWPGEGMPLSRLGGGGADCAGGGGAAEGGGTGTGPASPGGVMPLSRLEAAGADDCPADGEAELPLVCAIVILPGNPIATNAAPTTDTTQIRLLKRKTPHPRLELHPLERHLCQFTSRLRLQDA
jgi:hypothetical protein